MVWEEVVWEWWRWRALRKKKDSQGASGGYWELIAHGRVPSFLHEPEQV